MGIEFDRCGNDAWAAYKGHWLDLELLDDIEALRSEYYECDKEVYRLTVQPIAFIADYLQTLGNVGKKFVDAWHNALEGQGFIVFYEIEYYNEELSELEEVLDKCASWLSRAIDLFSDDQISPDIKAKIKVTLNNGV